MEVVEEEVAFTADIDLQLLRIVTGALRNFIKVQSHLTISKSLTRIISTLFNSCISLFSSWNLGKIIKVHPISTLYERAIPYRIECLSHLADSDPSHQSR